MPLKIAPLDLRYRRSLLMCMTLIIGVISPAQAENWPQFRGPYATGRSADPNLPIIWHEGRGVVWKSPLPADGASTPAVWGDGVFLTGQAPDGKLVALGIERKTGKIAWTTEIGSGEVPRSAGKGPPRGAQSFHPLHNFATPSPTTDGETVLVHFGNGDLAALDFSGQIRWKRNLATDYGGLTNWYGRASSPVIHSGLAIIVCMQDRLDGTDQPPAESYVVAYDLKTGRQQWKTSRPTKTLAEQADAYTTPVIAELNGEPQLIVMGANQLDGYNPASGERLWKITGLVGGRTVPSPLVGFDTIFAVRGLRGEVFAARPRGSGDNDFKSILWSHSEGAPDCCSPALWNDLLFIVSDDGFARCLHAPSGNVKWKQRLKGSYRASPVAVSGRVLFLNTDGLCTVVSAQPRFDKLVENQLDDQFLASPAVADNRLFLRGKKSLYCISK